MSWFSEFFQGKNPAEAAMPYYDQIAGMEKGYYDPYIGYGKEAYKTMRDPLNQMTSDPSQFLESIMGNYSPSRGYQLKLDEMMKAAGNTAAAGGMRGSLSDITKEARLADYLMGEDMQQWLQNVLGIQGRGLEGQQHLFDTGYNASGNLASDLANVLSTQGQLAFQGQNEQNKRKSDLLSSLTGAFGGVAGLPMSGGGSVGGNILGKLGSRYF